MQKEGRKNMYQDLGHKQEGAPTIGKEKYYPSLSFTTEEIPELKGKSVGDKVQLHIIGEVKGLRKNDKEMSYDIEFQKCSMKKMPKEEYDKMSDEDKDKADEEEVMEKSDE